MMHQGTHNRMMAGARRVRPRGGRGAFTMIEIAIALAIIGFALVAIVGILPAGLTVQRESREKTIINGDAQYFMEMIKQFQRGPVAEPQSDLTNFVERVDTPNGSYSNFVFDWEIVGLLCTPGTNDAWVRAITGTANDRRIDDEGFSFRYRLTVEVRPLFTARLNHPDRDVLLTNAWDVRFVFQWPLLHNGNVGREEMVYPTLISGPIVNDPPGNIYFYFEP